MTEEAIAAVRARYGVGPHLAADLVVVTVRWEDNAPDLRVLLIQRGHPPYPGHYALPGGFVDLDEDLEHAARRELLEETGLEQLGGAMVEQLGTYGDPKRDPRSRVVSVVHLALVRDDELARPTAGDDAADARFVGFRDGAAVRDDGAPFDMAFDHDRVLADAWSRLRLLASYSSALLALLPPTFTTEQLENLVAIWRGPGRGVAAWWSELGWIEREPAGRWRVVANETLWAPPGPKSVIQE